MTAAMTALIDSTTQLYVAVRRCCGWRRTTTVVIFFTICLSSCICDAVLSTLETPLSGSTLPSPASEPTLAGSCIAAYPAGVPTSSSHPASRTGDGKRCAVGPRACDHMDAVCVPTPGTTPPSLVCGYARGPSRGRAVALLWTARIVIVAAMGSPSPVAANSKPGTGGLNCPAIWRYVIQGLAPITTNPQLLDCRLCTCLDLLQLHTCLDLAATPAILSIGLQTRARCV